MVKSLQIVIIGTGNVSQHLLKAFSSIRSVEVSQIFNHRQTLVSKKLASTYKCELISNYNKLNQTADLYIICVKDEAISDVSKNLSFLKLNGVVVHTSGSTDMSVLKQVSKNTGVFYPLQSFSVNDVIDWKDVPILIEASNSKSLNTLKAFSKCLSNKVKEVNSMDRLRFHLAAVFANNFTNALYAIAYQLVENSLSKKDTELLQPLMTQSFHKMLKLSPLKSQTGPAKRGDIVTINKHLKLLTHNPKLKTIYKQLSALIVEQQKLN